MHKKYSQLLLFFFYFFPSDSSDKGEENANLSIETGEEMKRKLEFRKEKEGEEP